MPGANANFTVYNAVAVSSTTTYYSDKTSLKNLRDSSYHLSSIGTMTGTYAVWISNKPVPVETTDTDWVSLTLATAISQPAGSDTKDYVDLSTLPFLWVRLKYVNASGSGAITSYFTGKGY